MSERRQCDKCGSFDIWDRELSLDADGNVTITGAGVRCAISVICYTCKHNLSLGPSNDTWPVRTEIRAAELAVMPAGTYARNDEWAGWEAHDNGDSVPYGVDADETACWWAGWLARVIDEHKERDRG